MRLSPRSLWDWSCDMLAAVIVGAVFALSRVECKTCGDDCCTEVHMDDDD